MLWSRYPAKISWKNTKLVKPPKGYSGRAKKLGKCHYCGEMFAASHLEVDHVEQAGQCNSWETSQQFLYRLLDCNDNWVLACKPCHQIKSHSEKMGITFEKAAIAKQVLEICKWPKRKLLAYLMSFGYTEQECSNELKRKKLIEIILRENE